MGSQNEICTSAIILPFIRYGLCSLEMSPCVSVHLSVGCQLFTPRISDGCNSFDIVCLCVCVCLSVTTLRTNRQTWMLVCRSSGRISRSSSKVKVKGQGHQVKKRFKSFQWGKHRSWSWWSCTVRKMQDQHHRATKQEVMNLQDLTVIFAFFF